MNPLPIIGFGLVIFGLVILLHLVSLVSEKETGTSYIADDLVRVNPLLKMLTSQAPSAALQFPVSLSPAVTEEAISVLLRGIAGAMRPAANYTMGQVGTFGSAPLIPPIVHWWFLLPEGSLAHINTVSHESCDCPCPVGITAEFTVEWDAPGPFNPDLLTDEMKGGKA